MYGIIRRYTSEPGKAAEAMKRARQDLMPKITEQPGLIAFYQIDQGDGVFAAVAIFETEDQAKNSNQAVMNWTKANEADLLPTAPEITAGQVLFDFRKEQRRTQLG